MAWRWVLAPVGSNSCVGSTPARTTMMKKIKLRVALPIESGKTYTTKMATKEKFTVTKVAVDKKGVQTIAWGLYEKSPHLGDCPLPVERLIPETVEGETVEVCEHCGER